MPPKSEYFLFKTVLLVTAIKQCTSVPLQNTFLYTHLMSTSHLDVVFDVASKVKSENIYDLRWPLTDAVAKHKAPEGFKTIVFDKILERNLQTTRQIDEGAWDSGSENLKILKDVSSVIHLILSPCDLQNEIPMMPCNTPACNLTIADWSGSLCCVARARSMNSDVVFVAPVIEPYSRAFLTGASFPASYSTAVFVAKSYREMTFLDRVFNIISHQFFALAFYQLEVAKLLMPQNLSGIYDAIDQTLYFENTHRFVEWPTPMTRALIRMGASKDFVSSRKASSEELEKFMARPFRGFVIFSMSTYMSDGKMPKDVAEPFEKAFRNFSDYGFIWRTVEVPKDKADGNIYFAHWIPQKELLGDKRVVLLISHCGQNSYLEAIRNGVPVIGIPQMGDQFVSAKRLLDFSLGLQLSKDELSFEKIQEALTQMLKTPRENWRSNRVKEMLETEEMFGMNDNVGWWIEYRLRHGKHAFDRWIIPRGAKTGGIAYIAVHLLILLILLAILSVCE